MSEVDGASHLVKEMSPRKSAAAPVVAAKKAK
jgi:hypothetical protein